MNKPIFKVDNVSKSFGEKKVLENINFEIFEKEIIGFLGYSGSGKTTMLNIIAGFIQPTSGQVLYNSKRNKYQPVIEITDELKSQIGFSSQSSSFYPELTVNENLEYFASIFDVVKKDIKPRIESLLKILTLTGSENQYAKDLSEGMKKRLDIACALIHNPQILILDEPTGNLDFRLREELLTYIKKINSTGVTVIFVSHMIDEIKSICTKVLMINNSSKFIDIDADLKQRFNAFVERDRIISNKSKSK